MELALDDKISTGFTGATAWSASTRDDGMTCSRTRHLFAGVPRDRQTITTLAELHRRDIRVAQLNEELEGAKSELFRYKRSLSGEVPASFVSPPDAARWRLPETDAEFLAPLQELKQIGDHSRGIARAVLSQRSSMESVLLDPVGWQNYARDQNNGDPFHDLFPEENLDRSQYAPCSPMLLDKSSIISYHSFSEQSPNVLDDSIAARPCLISRRRSVADLARMYDERSSPRSAHSPGTPSKTPRSILSDRSPNAIGHVPTRASLTSRRHSALSLASRASQPLSTFEPLSPAEKLDVDDDDWPRAHVKSRHSAELARELEVAVPEPQRFLALKRQIKVRCRRVFNRAHPDYDAADHRDEPVVLLLNSRAALERRASPAQVVKSKQQWQPRTSPLKRVIGSRSSSPSLNATAAAEGAVQQLRSVFEDDASDTTPFKKWRAGISDVGAKKSASNSAWNNSVAGGSQGKSRSVLARAMEKLSKRRSAKPASIARKANGRRVVSCGDVEKLLPLDDDTDDEAEAGAEHAVEHQHKYEGDGGSDGFVARLAQPPQPQQQQQRSVSQ